MQLKLLQINCFHPSLLMHELIAMWNYMLTPWSEKDYAFNFWEPLKCPTNETLTNNFIGILYYNYNWFCLTKLWWWWLRIMADSWKFMDIVIKWKYRHVTVFFVCKIIPKCIPNNMCVAAYTLSWCCLIYCQYVTIIYYRVTVLLESWGLNPNNEQNFLFSALHATQGNVKLATCIRLAAIANHF